MKQILDVLITILCCLGFIGIIYGISYYISWVGGMLRFICNKKIKYKKYPKYKKVNAFRELPCKNDYGLAYFVMMDYNIMPRSSNMIGAYILKWINDGVIKINKKNIVILKNAEFQGFEQYIFNELKAAARLRKFVKSSTRNSKKVNISYFVNSFDYKELKSEFKKFYQDEFDKIKDNKKYIEIDYYERFHSTEKLDEIAAQILGLKKFFNEFDNMSDKEIESIKLWEDYLIYAQMLGVSKKVMKKLAVKFPKENFDSISVGINVANYCSRTVYYAHSKYTNEKTEFLSDVASYSAGGGGFSSGGGGGGSFGGGGGGGGFR